MEQMIFPGIEKFQKSLKDLNPALQFLLSISDNEGSLKTSAQVRLEAAARIVRTLNEVIKRYRFKHVSINVRSEEEIAPLIVGINIQLGEKK